VSQDGGPGRQRRQFLQFFDDPGGQLIGIRHKQDL